MFRLRAKVDTSLRNKVSSFASGQPVKKFREKHDCTSALTTEFLQHVFICQDTAN